MPNRRRHRVTALRTVATLVALSALAAACADEADGAGSPAGGDTGTIEGALGTLPVWEGDTDDVVTVTYGDLAAAAELADATRPDDPGDRDAVVDYVTAITGQAVPEGDTADAAVMLPERFGAMSLADQDEFVDDLGLSLLEIDRFVERSTPPDDVTVLDGDFDAGRIDDALGEPDDGVWSVGDPDGDVRLDEAGPARPLGEALWLSLRGDQRLVITRTAEDMDRALAAGDGDGAGMLADDPTLTGMAAALDRHDAYSAMLFSGGAFGIDPAVILGDESPEELAARLEEQESCVGITGVASGIADDGEALVVLVVASADDDAAAANQAVIERALGEGSDPISGRPWSDRVVVETIETEGPITTVTARLDDAPLPTWSRVLLDRSFPPC